MSCQNCIAFISGFENGRSLFGQARSLVLLLVYFYYFMNLKKERGGRGYPPPHRSLHFLPTLTQAKQLGEIAKGRGLLRPDLSPPAPPADNGYCLEVGTLDFSCGPKLGVDKQPPQ